MTTTDHNLIKKLLPLVKGLRHYHRHTVCGLNSIPEKGKVLLVVNHSLATYDIALLFHAIYQERGRLARALLDRLFYKIPYISEFMEATGGAIGNSNTAKKLLELGEIVAVAPGGMREALRPSSERYQIRWEKRTGFAKIAIETQTPVVIAVCPKADDMYEVYPNKLTKWAYQTFKIPVFLARGVGYTPIPRPVRLTHYLSEPIIPPQKRKDPEAFKKQVVAFHRKLETKAHKLIADAIHDRPGKFLLSPSKS
ncbi:MAG: lysophospholipid acyltransferase family protein [Bdellovibrionota bacterium]